MTENKTKCITCMSLSREIPSITNDFVQRRIASAKTKVDKGIYNWSERKKASGGASRSSCVKCETCRAIAGRSEWTQSLLYSEDFLSFLLFFSFFSFLEDDLGAATGVEAAGVTTGVAAAAAAEFFFDFFVTGVMGTTGGAGGGAAGSSSSSDSSSSEELSDDDSSTVFSLSEESAAAAAVVLLVVVAGL